MSLQVWLPLNGDLHNLGLNPLSVVKVQSGVNLDNAGKLGKCYTNSGSSANIATPCTFFAKTFSVCAWVRLNTRRNNWCRAFGMYGNGTYFGFGCEHTNGTGLGFHYYKTIDGTNTSIFDNYPVNISTGVWNHFVMCYDGVKYYIYLNGKLIKSDNANKSNIDCNMTTLYLFGGTPNNYSQCSLNDIRLYDHVLSAKEVEEISKGLILHYKLDDDNNAGYGWLYPNRERTITRTSNNTFIDYAYYPDLITSTDTSYTADFYAKGSVDGMKIDIYFRNSSGDAYVVTQLQTLTKNWEHYSLLLSGSPNALVLFRVRCYGGTANDIVYIRNMKLLSNNMLIRNDIVYDSSSYNNNGTIIGSLAVTTSSPRYTYSTKFANGMIHSNYSSNGLTNLTYCAWIYVTQYTNDRKCIIIGGTYLTIDANGKLSGYAYGKSPAGYHTGTKIIPLNTWTHVAIVWTDTQIIGYINGIQDFAINCSGTFTSPGKTDIGCENSLGNRQFYGEISDVRIYATALTETQIKELYNTSMSIDNKGNAYTRELMEV